MASQPSVYDEERNRLRLRAWELRNQETSQAKELNLENVPLFGEPYKTNKGDELSNKIQRMLGSYEDVNNPNPFQPLPVRTHVTFSQSEQPNPDKSSKPLLDQVHRASNQSQTVPPTNTYPSQSMGASAAASSPSHSGHPSIVPKVSVNHSPDGQVAPVAQQQKTEEVFSDLLPQEMSAQSSDTKLVPSQHSSDPDNMEPQDTQTHMPFDWRQHQESTNPSSAAMEVSASLPMQSPKDGSLPQAGKGTTLLSQAFPPLLPSKQPNAVMTQKPTAYVRPMDGQDQVVSESPELKPSPEPYAPLQELMISKSDHGNTKILPPFLEMGTNEPLCVEDILREMTRSWPPLLTAIHIPNKDEPSKFPAPAKEAERVSSCPGQRKYDCSNSRCNLQSSSSSFEAAHSSGVDSASSSDSDSSSGSDSDSDSVMEQSTQLPPDAPAVAHGDWQLGKWISSSQQTQSQGGARVPDSPSRQQPAQSSKHSGLELMNGTGEPKPQLLSPQKELGGGLPKLQQCGESSQSSQKCPSADVNSCTSSRKCSGNLHLSKPLKAVCSEDTTEAVSVKCVDVIATQDKDPRFTVRPKVKTKIGHSRKSKVGSDSERNSKRTKQASVDKVKTESHLRNKVKLVLSTGSCPSCGGRYPNPCSCHIQSPAPPVTPKAVASCQKSAKMPQKPLAHKPLEKPGHAAKASQDVHKPPKSLLVKIDLSLLSRVPRPPSIHQPVSLKAKRLSLVVKQEGRSSDASTKRTKHSNTSKKSFPENIETDGKTLPRKKRKLEKRNTSSTGASVKLETEDQEAKKAKKNPVQLPPTPKDTTVDSKMHKHLGETQASNTEAVKSKDKRKKNGKRAELPPVEKKHWSSSKPSGDNGTNRPLLRFDNKQHPVKHYIREAKRLKHRADAEADKLSKAFNYLDAAMYFVESGIAMEKDPQISMSSYTMFADTVELLKFVLKLKNSVDASAPPSEKDFVVLCLKCQSLLQMAMFHHKHKTALKYSKTLSEHFRNSSQAPREPSVSMLKGSDALSPSPTSNILSPSSASASSGSVPGPVGSTIEQMILTYVNITTLLLSAHDVWEQAGDLALKGSGLLSELDSVMGPLSLTSSVSSMVRYTRQGVLWLRLDSTKVK